MRDNKILLHKRKGSHGAGYWGFPGGHLEMGETPEECAVRETKEEAGIEIRDLKRVAFTNDIFSEEKHYVTLYLLTKHAVGEPEVLEPDKNEQWKWFNWNELPQPIFLPIQNLLKQGFTLS